MAAKYGGGGSWTEYGGGTGDSVSKRGERSTARFEEQEGIVREKGGDKGAVIVTARNQERCEEPGKEMILGGNVNNLNVVLDPKRRRIGLDQNQKDIGPEHMLTDGNVAIMSDTVTNVHGSKNLFGVGPGFQAHREL